MIRWQHPGVAIPGALRIEMNNSASHGLNHRFGAIVHMQLLHDMLQMHLDGFVSPPDCCGDVAVAHALGRQLKYFGLARC